MYKPVESSVVTPIGYHKSTQAIMKAEERKEMTRRKKEKIKKEKIINLTQYYLIKKVMNRLEKKGTDLNQA